MLNYCSITGCCIVLLFAVNSIVYDVGLYCYNVLCNGYVGSLSLLNIYQVGNGVRSTILYYCI